MKRMMRTGDSVGEVGNTQIIIVFAHITVIMEGYPRMEVAL